MNKINEELRKLMEKYEEAKKEEKEKCKESMINTLEKFPLFELVADYEIEYIIKTLYEKIKSGENLIEFNFDDIKKPRKKRVVKIKKEIKTEQLTESEGINTDEF